ncbi:hypothetical protein [Alloalcanivorax xenomutans]|uniref:hypothetical protein n=1 Tax=Alloalcanivorax xenomutans TaxID=1094342 RepID=UPI0009B6AC46|nr:hypothetical protein [Alloalcanivorax xenomutans]ARB44675.1 hypothetical protein P40_03900 [Alloalcanivorax xenomutans]
MEAKVQIKIGQIEFAGEGAEAWVSKQLDKVIENAEKLVALAPKESPSRSEGERGGKPMGEDSNIASKSLAIFLKEKNATSDQTKKFLATAVWLESKGNNRMKTGDVTKALKDSNQTRLGNASQCLSNNLKHGYCERDGSGFFVTTEGKDSL